LRHIFGYGLIQAGHFSESLPREIREDVIDSANYQPQQFAVGRQEASRLARNE